MALHVAGQQLTSAEAVRNSETCGCVNLDEPPDDELELMIDAASDTLAILSGGVTGRTTFTVRPCATSWCSCACPCCGLDGIQLPGEDPVVTSVRIDGVTIASDTYALHSTRIGKSLVRVSSTGTQPQSWPMWQSLWRPASQQDTFEIVYTSGIHVDWVIESAAIELTCDFATLNERRPNAIRHAASVTQGGVNMQIKERVDRIRNGESGPSTARFMGIYAPDGRQRSAVYSPEIEGGWELHVIG